MNWKTDYKNKMIDRLNNAWEDSFESFFQEVNRSSTKYDLYVNPTYFEVVSYDIYMQTKLLTITASITEAINYFSELVTEYTF